jgi:cysteinyl-tRNA synthetase
MDDDFNTPQAVAVIFDFTREVNRIIAENENISIDFYTQVKEFLQKTAVDVLGIIDFESGKTESDGKLEGELIELLIKIRQEAKNNKNFKLSDSIRDELKDLGIQLQDSKDKTTYKKIN